jgi:hypothetical protein
MIRTLTSFGIFPDNRPHRAIHNQNALIGVEPGMGNYNAR